MKKAIQTAIKSIVTLFILFIVNRMSKCQKNKYFIGSSCGAGSAGPKTENKDFQQSFAKLMAARDAQDSQIQAVTKPEATTKEKAIVPFQAPKGFRPSDIDIVLKGDF